MKRHHSLIAIAAGIVMAIIAALGFRGLPGISSPQAGEALIPDLAAKADSITEIDLLAGQTTSVLQKQGQRFVLSGQGNLPVPTDRVRQLLNQLAQIELLEPKTSNPARYAQLGVGAIMNDPQAREIRLLTGPNQLLADVIIGRDAPNLTRLGGGLYVRRASEAQSWLAEGQLQVPAGAALWAGGPLFPVQDERQLKSVTLSDMNGREGGERVIVAAREAPALPITHVEPDLPQPDQARLARLLALAGTLAASDIKALPANAHSSRLATFQAFDGTVYRLALYPEGKELWARASMEGGPAAATAKQFSADHATALYLLPAEAAALLQAQPADFAQLGEPAKKTRPCRTGGAASRPFRDEAGEAMTTKGLSSRELGEPTRRVAANLTTRDPYQDNHYGVPDHKVRYRRVAPAHLMSGMTALLLGILPAYAQETPAEPIPHLTITRPLAPAETEPVPRATTPQERAVDKGLQDAAIASLNGEADSASTACDTPIKARFDWSTIDPQEIAGNSAANACGATLSALAEACRIPAARDKIEAEVREVICTAGDPAPALDLRAGALIYTIDWQARDPAVFIYSWLMGNL